MRSVDETQSTRRVSGGPVTEGPVTKGPPLRVGYLMSRFPKLTETFVLYEVLAMEAQNVSVALYPLLREQPEVMHDEAKVLDARARYTPLLSRSILAANFRRLLRNPRAYLGTLLAALRGTWGSLRFLAGAVVFFPKAVYLAQEMQREEIQHIHAHFASHPAAVAYVIHRLTGIPYSFTAHGSDIHRDQHMLREKVQAAAFVVPISRYNREFILNHSGQEHADKMVVIHCGVDTSCFSPDNRTPGDRASSHNGQGAEQDEPFHILCIGTLHEVKGQQYLIEAVAQLARQGIQLRCHFVGGGPDRARLEAQAQQAGLDEQIIFHGQQTRTEVLAQLARADVVVAPSVPSSDGRREGIPVSLMEAMASALPVVASRLSGIPELVDEGETGLLVAPGDVEGLATTLTELYHSPALRRHLGEAGRQKVLAHFDLSQNAAHLADCFRKVVL